MCLIRFEPKSDRRLSDARAQVSGQVKNDRQRKRRGLGSKRATGRGLQQLWRRRDGSKSNETETHSNESHFTQAPDMSVVRNNPSAA